jgi:uncharacterized protein YllA (UPF0747 family)
LVSALISYCTEISSYPERFSPNVVMRPVYQEVILPNLAYIGGGAETTYWLQLKTKLSTIISVDFPVLTTKQFSAGHRQKI